MIELSLARFAQRLGLSVTELKHLCDLDTKYQIHRQRKSGGRGFRLIAKPTPELARVQRLILDRVLIVLQPLLSPYVYGGVKRRNHVRHARVHRRGVSFFVVDLKDAFTHGTPERMYQTLRAAGFEANTADALIALTTDAKLGLPQGAPTSPALFNLLCHELDAHLTEFAELNYLRYTRYVDELVFSGRQAILREEQDAILALVAEVQFCLNPRKLHRFEAHRGAARITGISVHDEQIGLSKKRREHIRTVFHRALTDPSISRNRIEGLMGQVRYVYGQKIPRRLHVAYRAVYLAFRRRERLGTS